MDTKSNQTVAKVLRASRVDTNTYHTSFIFPNFTSHVFLEQRLQRGNVANSHPLLRLSSEFLTEQEFHRPCHNETVTKESRFPFLCHHRFITFRTSLTRKFPVKNVISILSALTGKSPVKVGSGPLPWEAPKWVHFRCLTDTSKMIPK